MSSKMLVREIAQLCQTAGIGTFGTSNPDNRNIYVGLMPEDVTNGIWLVESPSPPPHQYVDTEYPVIDFWSMHAKTDLAHEKLEQVYNYFHRKYHYETANWHISFSQALGSIVDVDRSPEASKLFRLSVQFICRNLNNLS